METTSLFALGALWGLEGTNVGGYVRGVKGQVRHISGGGGAYYESLLGGDGHCYAVIRTIVR